MDDGFPVHCDCSIARRQGSIEERRSDLLSPRVSVLLPCFNGQKYVREAIASVLTQNFQNIELIVVDDGSTDRSASIINEIARTDSRIRVLRKANGGIVSALNDGLALCRGEFVARMDADDVSLTNRLQDQVDWLDSHPACVCVGGYAISDPVVTRSTKRTTGGRHSITDVSTFPPKVAVAMHPLIMVRRAALEAIGGYRDAYPHAEDYDLFIRLASHGTVENPPIDMLFYRRHEGAISVRNLALQEQSAARAEADAYQMQGGRALPAALFAAYVRLRTWRRFQSVDPAKARELEAEVLRDLLTLDPVLVFSVRYLRVRAAIARSYMRWIKRRRVLRQI